VNQKGAGEEMRIFQYGVLFIGLLGACQSKGARQEIQLTAERFLKAATDGDTASLVRLSVDHRAVERVMYIQRSNPTLLGAAARHLKWRGGDIGADSAKTFFVFPYASREEELALNLVRKADAWRVYYIGLLSR
jgi:hypothetical protein